MSYPYPEFFSFRVFRPHIILSSFDIRKAIELSVLASRWRYIWTSMPCLNLSSDDNVSTDGLRPLRDFSKFVNDVMSRRNNEIQVSSIKLNYDFSNLDVFERIMRDAFANDIQQLNLRCSSYTDYFQSLVSPFSSLSLKHLTISGNSDKQLSMPASTLELLALTTLHLNYVTVYDENSAQFSKFVNLKNLTLNHCKMKGSEGFRICHRSLTNLVITNCTGKHHTFTPELVSLVYKGRYPLHISPSSFCFLENVDLCIQNPNNNVCKICRLLQQLRNVKFLRLNSEVIELLSSSMELISHQPSPFANLKSLKIYPDSFLREEKETISTEIINYILDSSPSAAFTMITREECRVAENIKHVQFFMAELRVLLKKENADINIAKSQMAPLQNQNQLHIWRRTSHFERCWKDLSMQIEQGKEKTSSIVSKLHVIEKVLTKLPAPERAKIQPSFSSLSAEANTVMKNIMDYMKIQCNEKESRLNDYFNELTIASQTSS